METERIDRVRKSTINHISMEAGETLKRVEEDFPDNPEKMGYFYDLLRKVYCDRDRPSDRRITIGTTCIQVPEELIYAAGAVPLRLCSGAYSFERMGTGLMPARSCSLVKATLGMLSLVPDFYHDSLKALVIPTTCDQKKKAGEMIREMGIDVYFLDLPSRKDTEEARAYWYYSIKKFVTFLGKITGKSPGRKDLLDAVRLMNRAREEFRRFYSLRRNTPSPIYGKDAILVMNAFFFDEIGNWIDALSQLNNELLERNQKGEYVSQRHAPRILLTGSPPIFPNLKIPLLIEQTGGVIVADDLCSSTRLLYDTVVIDETGPTDILLTAISDRYIKPCTCPFLVENTDRKRRLLQMIRDFGIDGVVYQAFSGCHLFEMESKSVSRFLESEGIPMLYIETDYSPEDTGQLSTRVEAFLESIKQRKRGLNI